MTTKVGILLAWLLVLGAWPLRAAEVWRVASLEWPPYAGSASEQQGLAVERLRQLLATENIELEVAFYPWQRAQRLGASRDFVGYFPAWPEEVRPGFVASPAVEQSKISVMSYQGSQVRWRNLEHLFKHHVVGLVRTYVYPAEIQSLIDRYPENIRFASDERVLVKVLSRQRIDVALTDPRVMRHYADQERITNLSVVHPNLINKALVLSFRDDPENQQRIALLKRLLSRERAQ